MGLAAAATARSLLTLPAQDAPPLYAAIVADDLTGAGDTAIQFVRAGWATHLAVGEAGAGPGDLGAHGAEVLAVATHSRALPPTRAAAVVERQVARLREAGASRLYKKIDSTLRGPIRAEVDAARAAWRADAIAVVCPAFPATGRVVQDGILRVDGVPVAQTSAGTDPVTPVVESHVPTLLEAAHVAIARGESPAALAARIEAAGAVVAVDAASAGELELLARALGLLGERALPVGSGGLAEPLARVWAEGATGGPVVAVVTSQHRGARLQARAWREWGARVRMPALETLADPRAWKDWAQDVRRTEAGRPVGAGEPDAILLLAPEGRLAGLDSDAIAARLGSLAGALVADLRATGAIATGGDGARELLKALRATGIALVGEVAGGVPMGTLVGGTAPGLPVVTKAGGFGDEDVLVRAAKAIRERRFKR